MSELVLITGTSSGIGLATVRACRAGGYRVIATMRNLERSAALEAAVGDDDEVSIEQLDVTAADAVERVRALVLKFGPIYGLVNNAGIAVGGVFEEQSERDVVDQIATNVLGVMNVTRALLPSMRAAGRGRIVNVSSIAGLVAFPGLSVYAASKHALEGFSEGLRFEVEPFGVDVCLLEPGTFKTGIFFENRRRGEHFDLEGPYGKLNHRLEEMTTKSAREAPGPEPVAAKIAELIAMSARPPFRTVVGGQAQAMAVLRRLVPDAVYAGGVRRFLGIERSS